MRLLNDGEVECCGNDEATEDNPITFEEYDNLFNGLKINRAAVPHNIYYEMIKNEGQELK